MYEAIYRTLKEVARAKKMVYYGDIAPLVGVDLNTGRGRREIGRVLAEVCESEARQGHPLLGSVVVRKDTNVPGKGYFNGARRLGKLSGETREEELLFWRQELKSVHAHWSSQSSA
jgi:alkylated DNA nucleotide flippase Atl1